MAKIQIAIYICIFSIFTSISYAACDKTIPGHYPDRYVVNNSNGTITDRMTGLMWSKCIMGMTWNASRGLCMGPIESEAEVRIQSKDWRTTLETVAIINQSGFANYNDWRLPNIKELGSIMDPACLTNLHALALDLNAFDVYSLSSDRTSASTSYWSSTPSRIVHVDPDTQIITNQAWQINFFPDIGFGARGHPISHTSHARLVRGESQ